MMFLEYCRSWVTRTWIFTSSSFFSDASSRPCENVAWGASLTAMAASTFHSVYPTYNPSVIHLAGRFGNRYGITAEVTKK